MTIYPEEGSKYIRGKQMKQKDFLGDKVKNNAIPVTGRGSL
jgi:hypothetical protein